MTPSLTRTLSGLLPPALRRGLAASCLGCCALAAQQAGAPALTRSEGLVALDYEVIPVRGGPSLDLMGFHYLKPLNGWLYLGVGGHAPLVKGDYGGFMAFDATLHAQKTLAGRLFADAGLSLGGGAGGTSAQQSKTVSGSGALLKRYIGLGYAFDRFTLGVNYAGFHFAHSAIDHAQLDVFVQVPFSFSVGPYGRPDGGWTLDRAEAAGLLGDFGENILTQGSEQISQIHPEGTNTKDIEVFELQLSHFLAKNAYLYLEGGVGYRGLPLYNQVLGGVGYRVAAGPRLQFYGQVAAGSGGYAAETIDTGPGLLLYPKLTAEYLFNRNWGLALSAGYLFAPRGTSRNTTAGVAVSYHPFSPRRPPFPGEGDVVFSDRRLSLYVQSEEKVEVGGRDQSSVHLLTGQYDTPLSRHGYIPVQASIAFNAFLGYPGYGEVLAGLGAQTPDDAGHRLQGFAQALVGANVFGPILKPEVGVYCGLGPHLALRAQAGRSFSIGRGDGNSDHHRLRSDSFGLGLSYRFSLPE